MPSGNGLLDLKIAVICASNMNRSMEAHSFLSKRGFNVMSFGTNDKVKLPGQSIDKPNCYEFGVTYDEIYKDLVAKDHNLYTQNGILHMLERNRRIKAGPEKFQHCKEKFDVVITVEERVYDLVIETLESREKEGSSPVHVINIEIQDNHEEATLGAFLICELVTLMASSEDLDNDIDELLQEFEHKCKRSILHCVQFY
ncbi:unnamed protein product [Darwinula stevensoni]|uniref:RNA polymerase II subunit A C-terminal domain phosphatase SSU72 n=1 Tax=Darwinula stevensoni TaxID=69355 RepID=A0A7R8X9B2_9CRUS|nr:unnamed protein product [Darwinula stevensoni]CAG0888991.1 unnamed protein product [Darwinula stevensoni]